MRHLEVHSFQEAALVLDHRLTAGGLNVCLTTGGLNVWFHGLPDRLTGGFNVLLMNGLRTEEPLVVPVARLVAGVGEALASRCFTVFGAGGSSFAIASSGELDTLSCLSFDGMGCPAGPLDLFWRFGGLDVLMVRVHGRVVMDDGSAEDEVWWEVVFAVRANLRPWHERLCFEMVSHSRRSFR